MSLRIVTARLKLASVGQRLVDGLRRSSDVYLTVVSVYAPTYFRAPGDIMKCFYDELQDTLSHISSSDLLLVLGDLNVIGLVYEAGILMCGQVCWVILVSMILTRLERIC